MLEDGEDMEKETRSSAVHAANSSQSLKLTGAIACAIHAMMPERHWQDNHNSRRSSKPHHLLPKAKNNRHWQNNHHNKRQRRTDNSTAKIANEGTVRRGHHDTLTNPKRLLANTMISRIGTP